jgi:DNA repair protein RAD16
LSTTTHKAVATSSYTTSLEEEIRVSRRLQAVDIPTMTHQYTDIKPNSKATGPNSPSDTTLTSLDGSTRATSLEYDTPGTTPAHSIVAASGKRKRSVKEEETADEKLARRLQEEEYGAEAEAEVEVKSYKRSRLSTYQVAGTVADSEDDSELSEPESISSAVFRAPGKRNSAFVVGRRQASAGAQQPSSSKRKVKIENSVSDADSDAPLILRQKSRQPKPASSRSAGGKLLKHEDYDMDLDVSDPDAFSDAESEYDFGPEAASTGVSDTESNASELVAPVPKSRVKSKSGGSRRRRFGNLTASDAANMVGEIDSIIERSLMSRKDRERRKLEKSHPGIKTMWEDLAKIPVIEPVAAAQPSSINRTLKSFQLQGLDWMTRQEKTHYGGGLLGDEMGMGKTIQAVSLIMSDYPQKQPTLVVVPPVALMQWSSEITDYTDGKLKVLVYHGQNSKVKAMTTKDIKKFDVVMISYNSLESLYRKETKGWSRGEDIVKEDSPIHAITFHRLILDEAHSIKSRTTGVAKACFALKGTYKWCLSGTPVQNRIGEFFSLLRFLEVRPFADYFCKSCPCAILHWKLDDDHRCSNCKHSGMEHVSVFNQELLNPLTQSDDPKVRSDAMDKLHMITARIMLRRVKRDYVSSMELPPKEVIVRSDFFGLIERDFSSSIMSNTGRQFDTYVSRNVVLNNYANIFGLIMQMRQVANHPDLLLRKSAEGGQNVHVCNICDEVAEDAIRSQCKHDFCRSCVKSYIHSTESAGGEPDCPRCHIPLAIDLDQPEMEQDEEGVKKSSIVNRIKMEDWTSSTKIEMLIYELYKLRSKKQTLKSIVFSQFTSMLQLVEWRLRRAGFNTVMLDGSMTPIQRQRSIEYFMKNTDVEVFLVSLKAGGVALNLTEASRVFIVDPYVHSHPLKRFCRLTQFADGGIPQPNGNPLIVATALARRGRVSSLACASKTRSSHAWSCCKRRKQT